MLESQAILGRAFITFEPPANYHSTNCMYGIFCNFWYSWFETFPWLYIEDFIASLKTLISLQFVLGFATFLDIFTRVTFTGEVAFQIFSGDCDLSSSLPLDDRIAFAGGNSFSSRHKSNFSISQFTQFNFFPPHICQTLCPLTNLRQKYIWHKKLCFRGQQLFLVFLSWGMYKVKKWNKRFE